MKTDALKPLFLLALRNPREAAKQVLAADYPPQAMWIVLSLTAVLTGLFSSGRLLARPLSETEINVAMETAEGQQVLAVYSLFTQTPMLVTLMLWGLAVVTVVMLYWVGKTLGGQGRFTDVLCIFSLLQVMTLLLSVGIWVLQLVVPPLASLASLMFLVWSIWAIVSFLDVAHGFGSALKSFGVLVAAIVGTVLGLSLIMGLIGGMALGLVGAT